MLCKALHQLRLPLSSEPQCAEAAAFLLRCTPVHWAPAKRKAEWQAPLCALLTHLLRVSPPPPAPGGAWTEALREVRSEMAAWLGRGERKHAQALPLLVALLAAEREPGCAQLTQLALGPLARGLRERSSRGAALEALSLALAAAHSAAEPQLWAALQPLCGEVPRALRRGPQAVRGEAESEAAFIAEALAQLLAAQPQQAADIACELLQLPEALPAVCRALLAAACAAGDAPGERMLPVSATALARALRRTGAGEAALPQLSPLPSPLRSALGALARAAEPLAHALPLPPSAADAPLAARDACCALLQLAPLVLPEEWSAAPGASLLPFALAPDAQVRQAGAAALRRLTAEGGRGALLLSLCEAARGCADEGGGEQAVQAALLAQQMAQHCDWPHAAQADQPDWPRCEGAAISLLAAPTAEARAAALALLRSLQQLRLRLQPASAERAAWAVLRGCEPLCAAAAQPTGAAWASALGDACLLLRAAGCVQSLEPVRAWAVRRLAAATAPAEGAAQEVWRCLATLAAASGTAGGSAEAAVAKAAAQLLTRPLLPLAAPAAPAQATPAQQAAAAAAQAALSQQHAAWQSAAAAALQWAPTLLLAGLGGATPAAWAAGHVCTFSGLAAPLPANVHLLTAHALGVSALLLRLAHAFEAGEGGAAASADASVDLAGIFAPPLALGACTEMTVTGSQPLADVRPTTYNASLSAGGGAVTLPVLPTPPQGPNQTVTLSALQIRTFLCDADFGPLPPITDGGHPAGRR